ncbi:MAG: hypothetical protein LBR57_01025 [Alistipes sp.]|jgi:hypothetical protein|nr:hypothetical protein [Alistipes sp.]
MKTSTKILLGLAAATIALCIVNGFIAAALYKQYASEARRIAAELDATPIKVLDVTLAPEIEPQDSELLRSFMRKRFNHENAQNEGMAEIENSDTDGRQTLQTNATVLAHTRVEGNTLRINGVNSLVGAIHQSLILFRSPSLETVIIRETGKPDEVITLDKRPSEEEMTEAPGEVVPE